MPITVTQISVNATVASLTAASAPQHYARAQAMHAPMQCRAGERPTPELAVPERSTKLPLLI